MKHTDFCAQLELLKIKEVEELKAAIIVNGGEIDLVAQGYDAPYVAVNGNDN